MSALLPAFEAFAEYGAYEIDWIDLHKLLGRTRSIVQEEAWYMRVRI